MDDSSARVDWRFPYRMANHQPSENGIRAAGSSPSTGGEPGGGAPADALTYSGEPLTYGGDFVTYTPA